VGNRGRDVRILASMANWLQDGAQKAYTKRLPGFSGGQNLPASYPSIIKTRNWGPAHGGATVATDGSGGAIGNWRHRSPGRLWWRPRSPWTCNPTTPDHQAAVRRRLAPLSRAFGRGAVSQPLTTALSRRHPSNTWSGVVDVAPYDAIPEEEELWLRTVAIPVKK